MKSIPTATSLQSARTLQARYSEAGVRHYILLGDCDQDRQTYFVATRWEAKKLMAAGYELAD